METSEISNSEKGLSATSIPAPQRVPDDHGDVVSHTVPPKYRGTAADQLDMATLGKKQVLRRNFRFVTMLGFGSTVICSWEIVLPVFTFVLTDGGTGCLFWGFIAVTCGMLLVYASLAEMASIAPTAGGQYHWVSEFAPPKYQKVLSYLTGWLCTIGWQVFLASVCFMVGGILQGIIALNDPTYSFQPFHQTLLAIGIMCFAVIFNTVLAVRLPFVQGCALVLHIAGFFVVFVPMWVLAPKANAQDAIFGFNESGNWGNVGLASMIGLQSSLSALIGYDCSVHMSEELSDAASVMPRAIMWAVGPNAGLGFLMAVTLVFHLGNAEEIAETPTGQPFMQVFYNGVGSLAGTNGMVIVVALCLTACAISEVATASRQLWSFARDSGLPFSKWLVHVAPSSNIPMRAVLTSMVFTSLLACINLGSSTALNAINSLGGVSIVSSYMVTIGCLIWRRLYGAPLPKRNWSLGRHGLPINIAAFLFLTPLFFFVFWPLAQPVTPSNHNWSSVMFVGILLISAVYYMVHGRHVYVGPVMLINRQE